MGKCWRPTEPLQLQSRNFHCEQFSPAGVVGNSLLMVVIVRELYQRGLSSGLNYSNFPRKSEVPFLFSKDLYNFLLLEEILHHLLCMKSHEIRDILNINWCRIFFISSLFGNRRVLFFSDVGRSDNVTGNGNGGLLSNLWGFHGVFRWKQNRTTWDKRSTSTGEPNFLH